MKYPVFAAALFGACLSSCDREKPVAKEPKEAPPAPASEVAGSRPPAAVRVIEPQDFKVAEEEPGNSEPSPGQRLDRAIEKTGEGLETAKEKTEKGLLKAAEATGGALRRAGDAIERKASEKSR